MKNLFLSLAVIATLTVVSCKQTEKPAEEATVEPPMEAAPTEAVVDSTAAAAGSAVEAAAATSADAAAGAVKDAAVKGADAAAAAVKDAAKK